jgi:uncharacterized protein YjbJ (UPF0337 family)
MTSETLKSKWHLLKGALKEKYSKLTEDDLRYVENKEEELYHRLEEKLGKTRVQVDHELEHLHAAIKAKEEKEKHAMKH